MSLRIIFLGTSASIPTDKRALPSIIIQRKGEILMFDCGEGTQRQMIRAGIKLNRKMKIFITHMHGDHVLGLPGVIQTMSLLGRTKKLQIYGPGGIKAFMETILNTIRFWLVFPLEICEIHEEGLVCDEEEYEVHAVWAEHTVPSLAYALIEKPRPGKFYPEKAMRLGVPKGPLWSMLQKGMDVKLSNSRVIKPTEVTGPSRPGRKIVYSGDTRPSKKIIELSREADVLIHEATFDDEMMEKAVSEGHSTAGEAAEVASAANVKLLILTHISARYNDSRILLEQAKKTFLNVHIPNDLDLIEVPPPENFSP